MSSEISLLQMLYDQSLQETASCDLEFICEDGIIRAHKCVLEARSKDVVGIRVRESTNKMAIDMHQLPASVVREFVKVVYQVPHDPLDKKTRKGVKMMLNFFKVPFPADFN